MYKYIVLNDDGSVQTFINTPIEGVTIDVDGISIPKQPTDAIYALYYNAEQGFYYVKVADLEPSSPIVPMGGEDVTWDSMAQAISEGVNDV